MKKYTLSLLAAICSRVLCLILALSGMGSTYAQSPTSPARGFNVFVLRDATLRNGETDGGVAVGGNLVLNDVSYQVNTQNKSTFQVRNQAVGLLVGGRVDFNSGNVLKVDNGIVKIGDASNARVWYRDPNNATPPTRITRTGDGFDATPRLELAIAQAETNSVNETGLIDFDQAFQELQGSSLGLSGCQNNVILSPRADGGGSVPQSGNYPQQLYYQLQTGRTNTLNIKGSDLNNVNVFAPVNNSPKPSVSTPLVINIDASGSFEWNVPNFSTLSITESPFILINFYNTTSLDISGSASVIGSVFAPFATITKSINQANIEGQIIGLSYVQAGGENHDAPFSPGIAPCSMPCDVTVMADGDDVCVGEDIFLMADGSMNVIKYAWTGPGGFTSTEQTPIRPNATTAHAGAYTVLVTGMQGASCTASASALVSIANITASVTATPNPLVIGQSITLNLTQSGAQFYQWIGPNNFSSTAQSPIVNNASNNNAGVYQVELTGATGCTTTATVRVAAGCDVSVSASGQSVCVGGTLGLTANAPNASTYTWSGANSFSSTVQNPNIPNATFNNAGGYTVTAYGTNSAVCSATAAVQLGVSPIIAGASSNSPIASGSTIGLSSFGGYTFQWSGPNGFNATSQNPTQPNATTAMGGVYTVVSKGDTGCTATVTTNVVIQQAACLVSVSASGQSVCIGGTLGLTANAQNATSYAWAGPNSFSSSLQNPSIPNAITGNAGVYSVTAYGSDTATCSATATVRLVVNPIVAGASSNSPIASGSTIGLSSFGGYTFQWSGPNGFNASTQNPTLSDATTAMSGVYTMITQGDVGCTATLTTSVLVQAAVCNVAVAASGQSICVGGTLGLTANAQNATTYAWAGPNGFSSTLQNPSVQNASSSSTGIYTVTAYGSATATCSATATASLSVNPMSAGATANISASEGGTVNFSAFGGNSFQWAGPGGFTSTLQSPNLENVTTAMAGVYTLSTNNESGCSATVSTSVIVVPQVCNVRVSPTGTSICWGKTLGLSANAQGAGSFAWAGPNGFSSTLQNPSRPNATYPMIGTYSVTAYGANTATCSATATTSLTVYPVFLGISSNTPVATGGTIALTAFSGLSYSWAGPAGFSSTLQYPTRLNATTAHSGRYTVTVNGVPGCSFTISTNVIVQPPVCEVSGFADAKNVCVGQTLALSVSDGVAGNTYQWAGPAGFTSTLQNPLRNNTTTAFSGLYTVTIRGINATCTLSSEVEALVFAPPAVTALSNTPVASGETIAFTAIGGNVFSWAGPGSFSSTVQYPARFNANGSMAGTYTVSLTSRTGCSNTATTLVGVLAPAFNCIKPNAGTNRSVCVGTASLNLPLQTNADFIWGVVPKNPAAATIDAVTGAIRGMNKRGVYRFVLKAKQAENCADTLAVRVGILDITDFQICSPDHEFAMPTVAGNIAWKALASNAYKSNISNTGLVTGMSRNGVYRYMIDNGTCKDTVTITRRNCQDYPIDLALKKSVSKSLCAVGDTLSFVIKVWNDGPSEASGVEVKDLLVANLQYVSSQAQQGDYNNSTGIWKVGTIVAEGDTLALRIRVKVLKEAMMFNTAEVCKADQEDIDSTPCNQAEKEDDLDRVCLATPFKVCENEKIIITSPENYTAIQWYKDGQILAGKTDNTLEVSASGVYSFTAIAEKCSVSSCCPINVIRIDCCKADACIPFIVKMK